MTDTPCIEFSDVSFAYPPDGSKDENGNIITPSLNSIIIAVLLFLISYNFKPEGVFFIDFMVALVTTCIATVMGSHYLSNQIRYIETKDQKLTRPQRN